MSDKIVLGVDSSTSATKVIAFTAEGHTLAEGANRYPLYSEHPSWVEQDPEDWWTAFAAGCKTVTGSGDVDIKRIAGIGLTHQRFTFVPVDKDIRPLRRAILWNDIRCSKEAEFARKMLGAGKIFERTGYPPGQWTLYKALWLKNNEPEVYEKTYKLVLVQDYLIYRLTGNLVTLSGAATMSGALDITEPTKWAYDVIEGIGVRKDIWIEPILKGGVVAGTVTKKAAEETGLPEGLPVVTGAGDQPCGTLGAGVTQPGEIAINGGTSCTNEFVSDGLPKRDKQNYFIEISPTGDYLVENYIPSGGSALMNWYKDNFGHWECDHAEKNGHNVYDIIYNQAGETPAGNYGAMLVPYFQGANGPFWDLNARGIFLGLNNMTGRSQMVRAIMEGLAYESLREAELMEEGTGTRVERIMMYGGSAKSDYWNQTFSDVFNRPLSVPHTAETTSLGAAISVAVATGLFGDFKSCVKNMVTVEREYKPITTNAVKYEKFYRNVYVKIYDRLADLMSEIATINEQDD